jgi:hypothetical protein
VFDLVQERLHLRRSQLGFDDLIDAAVCLLTARRVTAGLVGLLGDEARFLAEDGNRGVISCRLSVFLVTCTGAITSGRAPDKRRSVAHPSVPNA